MPQDGAIKRRNQFAFVSRKECNEAISVKRSFYKTYATECKVLCMANMYVKGLQVKISLFVSVLINRRMFLQDLKGGHLSS